MGDLRIEAKTLDDAITKACVELGITSDKLEYKVIEHGSKGFFGIGAKDCIISVSAKNEDEASEKIPAKEVKKAVEAYEERVRSDKLPSADNKDKETDVNNINSTPAPAADNEPSVQPSKDQPVEEAVREQRPERYQRQDRPQRNNREYRNNRRSDRGSDFKTREKRNDRFQSEQERSEQPRREEREIKPVVLTEDPAERARIFLESLFKSMDMKIDYNGEYAGDINELTVNLSGEDMGVLIGKRGQTLDALQYLTSQVVNKHQNGYIRVKLDTENYRERRKETLETFAVNMAHKVKRNKRPVVLEPMNAYERRIIHSVLQNEKDVITRSEGEEPYRHVVICPVRKRNTGYKRETAE